MKKVVSYFYSFSGFLAAFIGGFLVLWALLQIGIIATLGQFWQSILDLISPTWLTIVVNLLGIGLFFMLLCMPIAAVLLKPILFLLEKLLLVLAAFLRETRTHLWLVGAVQDSPTTEQE